MTKSFFELLSPDEVSLVSGGNPLPGTSEIVTSLTMVDWTSAGSKGVTNDGSIERED